MSYTREKINAQHDALQDKDMVLHARIISGKVQAAEEALVPQSMNALSAQVEQLKDLAEALLAKLDSDAGVTDSDYSSTLLTIIK